MDDVQIYDAARFLAKTIDPLFVLLLAGAPLIGVRARQDGVRKRFSLVNTLKWTGYFGIGVALPVVLAESGKKYEVWSGHPGFPSGHETFAASAATCLIVCHPRLAPIALVLAATIAWALVCARFHTIDDVLGAMVLGPICAIAIALLFRIRQLKD